MPENFFASTDEAKALEDLENARVAHQNYLIKQQDQDRDIAIEYYVNAAKHNPKLPETYYRLAFLMWESGQIDIETAIKQCSMALEYSPKSANARIYKGFFEKLAENFEGAESEFRKAVNLTGLKSARPRLMLALSILRRMSNQKIKFIDAASFIYYLTTGMILLPYDFSSVKALSHSAKEDILIFAFKKTGLFLEKFKMINTAKRIYQTAADKTGRNEIFYSKMGDISLFDKNPQEAYNYYKKALKANSKDKTLLMKLATLTQTYFPELVDESIDYYTSLLELNPKDSGLIYYELGHLYLEKSDKVNSICAFRLALENDKTNPFFHNSLAYAYLKAELYEDAISHYNTAISINPDNEWTAIVCHALGSVYGEIFGNLDLAIEKFKEGAELDPKNCDIKLSLGDAQMAINDIDNAIRSYCDAINTDSNNYRAYSKVGLALWEKDMIEESLISLHKSIDLNPNFDIAQNNLGVIYLDGLGCASDSLPFFEKALELNPSYTLAYFNAARAYELLENKTKAAEYYQMSLDMNKLTEDLDENEIKEKLHSLFEL